MQERRHCLGREFDDRAFSKGERSHNRNEDKNIKICAGAIAIENEFQGILNFFRRSRIEKFM
jgi:hypothetical protein